MSLKAILQTYLGLALDAIEETLNDPNKWPGLRARILKIFGDRGFARHLEVSDEN